MAAGLDSSGVAVHVQYATERKGVPGAAELRRWAQAALAGRVERGELVVRIVGEAESAELNHDYRGKSGPTNVLSFPFEPPPGIPSPVLGDLIICAPVVRKEAREQGKSARAHWAHMVVHGCLHLLGYDHQQEQDAEQMEALEVAVLDQLGIADPYGCGEEATQLGTHGSGHNS